MFRKKSFPHNQPLGIHSSLLFIAAAVEFCLQAQTSSRDNEGGGLMAAVENNYRQMFASPSSERLPEGGGFTQAEATNTEITSVMSGRPGQITHRLSVVSHISFTSMSPPFVLGM